MKVTGHITDISFDFSTNKPKVTLLVNEKQTFLDGIDEIKGCERLTVEVKKYHPRRSLNANNYAWSLLNEIANVLRADKDEVYLRLLKRYGQSDMISVRSDVDIASYVRYYEEVGESRLNGTLFRHYRVYKGSSEFDTREMSIFIDGIVSEAKELGISTETPEQLALLKERWK